MIARLCGLLLVAWGAALAQVPMEDEEIRRRFDLRPLPPIPYPENNTFNPDRVELGRLLFFDPITSGEKDAACGTCHLPKFGMADGRQLAAGTSGKGLGPDRVLGHSTVTGDTVIAEPRHTMTIFNTAYNGDESGRPSPRGFMLWDGKDRGLEGQALRPIIVRVELRGDGFTREAAVDSVLERLRSIPEYVRRFEQAFPAEADSVAQQIPRLACQWDTTPLQSVITRSTLSRALAAFEREQVTANTYYDRYVAGDDGALSDAQKRGLILFHTKAQCASCHSGPLFTDSSFRVQGVAQIGPGQSLSSTNTGTPRSSGRDLGRFLTSGNVRDLFAFRVVGLRQIAQTAPYMHDGALETLEEVIEFYDRGAGDEPTIERDRIDASLTPLGLTAQEKADLVAFMHALSDPTFAVQVPRRVPSGLEPAGLQLQLAEFGEQGVIDPPPLPSSRRAAPHLSSRPNPFNAATAISLSLSAAAEVEVEIYNVLGQRLRLLAAGWRAGGEHRLHWDGRDEGGREVASGVYLVAARAGQARAVHRVLLLR